MDWRGASGHRWVRLGAAVALVLAGAGLRLTLFRGFGTDVHYVTFYPMVILAALLGGLAAGLLATGLSVAVTYFWINGGDLSSVEWRSTLVFIVSCSAISMIVEYMRRATARARRAEAEARRLNEDLERRVDQRTAELKEANSELESFVYSASHDLRAPLRSIDGFSAIVIEDAGDRLGDDAAAHLARVRAASQRMAALIDSLLSLSRTSQRGLVRRDVDLTRLAAAVVEALQETDPGRRVRVAIAPGMHADADEDLTRIVLANLLGNAWKFTRTRPEAHIEFGAVGDDGEQVFCVRDDGVGFDQEYAKNLFGAFQRMHGADEFEGDGIGLATVQRIVHRHGGRVWAEAEVGKGAAFYFTLPPAA